MINKKHIAIGTGVGAVILWLVFKTKAKFHQLVKGQKVRGDDAYGNGVFGAPRTHDGDHNGLDIVAQPGEAIYSPVDGKIKQYSYPYPDKSFSGYHLLTDKYLIKLWYLAPTLHPGDLVKAGQVIGFAQNLGARYPGITNHVHMEVWDLRKMNVAIDPALLF